MAKKVKLGCENVSPDFIDRVGAEKAMGEFLTCLGIDWQKDAHMANTPARVARMYIDELFKGRYTVAPEITDFASNKAIKHDSLLMSGPWDVKSCCSHHLLPVIGTCFIGILPQKDGALPGLSKYGRVVEWYSRRPQIQEYLVEQIADHLEKKLKPRALGVYIYAAHSCCTFRGINSTASRFITSSLRGDMMNSPDLKQEFIQECHRRIENN